MKIKTRKTIRKKLTGQMIDAMTPAERQRLVDKLERETPQQRAARSKPITPADQARLERIVGVGRGRPKLGKGTRAVSVTVEVELLQRADRYAKQIGVKRSELMTRALNQILPKAG